MSLLGSSAQTYTVYDHRLSSIQLLTSVVIGCLCWGISPGLERAPPQDTKLCYRDDSARPALSRKSLVISHDCVFALYFHILVMLRSLARP